MRFTNVGQGLFTFPEDSDDERRRFKATKVHYEVLVTGWLSLSLCSFTLYLLQPLMIWWKNMLSEELEEVKISQRLHEDPCVIVSHVLGKSATMERISKAQAYGFEKKSHYIVSEKRVLEINPSHPTIKELLSRVVALNDHPEDRAETEELAKVLFEGAVVNSGYSLRDPAGFS